MNVILYIAIGAVLIWFVSMWVGDRPNEKPTVYYMGCNQANKKIKEWDTWWARRK